MLAEQLVAVERERRENPKSGFLRMRRLAVLRELQMWRQQAHPPMGGRNRQAAIGN